MIEYIDDDKDMARLAYNYLNVVRCVGNRLIVSGYRCPHCGSIDPRTDCKSPINNAYANLPDNKP